MANCMSGFTRINDLTRQPEYFPCGVCYDCKMRRLGSWYFRLKEEAKVSRSAMFLTLTYSDDFLPMMDNGKPTLYKPDLQNFWKRLRKDSVPMVPFKSSMIRYYACGEYGGKFGRPHYHAILFNSNSDDVEDKWRVEDQPIGNCHFDPVTDGTIKYVAGYMNKYRNDWYDEKMPEFAVMSKGLGLSYVTKKMVSWHGETLDRMYLNDGDKKMAMPRYYKNKIYSEEVRESIGIEASLGAKDMENKKFDELLKVHGDAEGVRNFLYDLQWDKVRKMSRNATKRRDL